MSMSKELDLQVEGVLIVCSPSVSDLKILVS